MLQGGEGRSQEDLAAAVMGCWGCWGAGAGGARWGWTPHPSGIPTGMGMGLQWGQTGAARVRWGSLSPEGAKDAMAYDADSGACAAVRPPPVQWPCARR